MIERKTEKKICLCQDSNLGPLICEPGMLPLDQLSPLTFSSVICDFILSTFSKSWPQQSLL